MPRHPKCDKTGEIVRPTIELRPWVRDLHAWLKAPSGNGAGKDPPQTSLASSSRRGVSQRGAVANTEVEANDSSSDSSRSAGSSPGSSGEEVLRGTPQGVSSGKNMTKDAAPRSAMRASRPSPWRRYLERVVEAKIREYFETRAGRGGAAEMRSVEECDGAKGMSHDGAGNSMEGNENNEVQQDLEAGIYRPHVDPTNGAVGENSKRSDAGKDKFRSIAEDVTEQGKPPFGPGVQGHNKRGVDDNFREVKLRKKDRGRNTKKSQKNGLAQQVLNWLVFDGPPSLPRQAQNRSYKPHGSSRDHHIDRERGVEGSKEQGKNRDRSINKTAPENDDLARKSPSQSPSPHRARHGRKMDHHDVRAVHPSDSPRAKTSLARDLARWILGSQKSPSEPAQKRQGRHLSYATTHGTSMQRVERLLRQGLEVERGLEAAYQDLPGKKGKERGGEKVMESTKMKIGKMVLRYLIGEGEKGIREAEKSKWGDAGGERLRGRSRVREEGFGEGNSTNQRTEKRNESHRSDRKSGDKPVRSDSPSPISSLPSDSHYLPSQLPPGEQPTSSRARKKQPSLEPQSKQKTYHVPLPTDSESSG